MLFSAKKRSFLPLPLLFFAFSALQAQCPTLGQNATFSSSGCAPGSNPCALCPGEMFTLTPTGTNLQDGDCINWYYGTTNNFNPYNGEGTLLGCSELTEPPIMPCNPNPIMLGFLADACGTEQNNEFMAMWSGGGFTVDAVTIDFFTNNNVGAANDDIGAGCGWQTPSAALMGDIQSECGGANIVAVGPGDNVPPGVPVLMFTSSGYSGNVNFSGLCAAQGTVYVMQSDCDRTSGAFSNSAAAGEVHAVSVSIGCWSTTLNYQPAQFTGNGTFVFQNPITGTTGVGNAGCSYPSFPPIPGSTPPIIIDPLTVTVDQTFCNGGPYYVVGIYEPLPAGCTQTFTNYLAFDVPCPMPMLSTADICDNITNFDLNTLEDPAVPNGTWSGTGVTGNNFSAVGLSGTVTLTFTPAGPCATATTTDVTIVDVPGASFAPVTPICPGGSTDLVISFTGQGPWSFELFEGVVLIDNVSTSDNPYTTNVSPGSSTSYFVRNLTNGLCDGPDAQVLVSVTGAPSAQISLAGPSPICEGQMATLSVNFTGGTGPYTVVYSIEGDPQPPVNATSDPYIFDTEPLFLTSSIVLVSVTDDNGCIGNLSGEAFVEVSDAPTATIPTVNATVCAGIPQNIPVTFTGGGPYTLIYRINGVIQPVVNTSTNPYNITVTPASGSTSTVTLVSVTNGACPGIVAGTYTLTVGPPPTATLSGTDTICSGQSAPLLIDLTGSGTFTINYTANGVAQTPITTTTDPYILNVSPGSVTSYELTGVSLNGCVGTTSGSAVITIAPPVSATLSGGGQICQGGSGTTLSVSFSGPGPYTLTYTATAGGNTTTSSPITTSLNPYTFNVNPNVGTTYQLASLSNGVCSGTTTGQAVVFVFTPPSATMSGSNAFCGSADTSIIVDFTGTGPFTFTYSKDGVTQAAVTTFDDPYIIDVNVSSTTIYNLISVESPGCTGTVGGNATITINNAPNYANLLLTCNAAQNNYVVTFDVLGATPPLTLVSGTGTFTGTQFTSATISQSSGYSFTFHDANNCANVTVSGNSNCNCVTQAGTMSLTALDACINGTVTATHNNNFVNDGNDVLRYILHSNPALPIGTIYAWSLTPMFTIQPGMMAGQTYYISAIAGNPTAGNDINLADPCLSVSQGTPVTFHALPTASMGVLDTSICAGAPIEITVSLIGTPPFSFANTVQGIQQPAVSGISAAVYSYTVNPTQNTLIVLDSIADLYCADGTVSGNADISVIAPPTLSAPTTTCDFATGTYTVSFNVTAGLAPYTVTGLSGSFSGNTFTSVPVPFASLNFAATVSDANNCGQTNLSGLAPCSCTSDAGNMSNTAVKSCTGDVLTVPAATGVSTDGDDIVMYIMRDGAGLIVAWSAIPSFLFVPPMQTGVAYTVSAVVGNPDGSGQVDLTDPCADISNGTPVQWSPAPSAFITGNYDACPGVPQAILVTLSGTPPYTLTYTSNATSVTTPPINNNAFSIFANLIQTTTYTLTGVLDANCPGTVSGQAVVTVHPVPTTANVETFCSADFQSYTLEFDVTAGDTNTIQVSGVTGNFDIATGHFTSDPIPAATPYNVSVTDVWNCGTATFSGTSDCSCQTDAGTMSTTPINLCNGLAVSLLGTTGSNVLPGDTLLYYLVTSSDPLSWTVLATNNTPNFNYLPGITIPGNTYYIVAVAGPKQGNGIDFFAPCTVVFVGPTVRWRIPVTAALSGNATICPGGTFALNIESSGDGPYQILYTLNNVLQPAISTPNTSYSFQPNVSGSTNNFALVSVTGAGSCPGTVSGTAVVQVNTPPQATNVTVDCDLLTSTYVLVFDISNGAAPNANYAVTGLTGTITDTTFTSNAVPSGTLYTVTIADPNGCSSSITGQPECVCTTNAGSLSPTALNLCTKELAIVTANGDSDLDPEDKMLFVLYTDPTQLPSSIIAVSASPQFGFGAGMTVGTTYYIAAVAGDSTAVGAIDTNDPCIALSPGIPVVFFDPPTATTALVDTLCAGENASFQVTFTGTAPFILTYSRNGTPVSVPITTSQNPFIFNVLNIQADQTFSLISVADAHCDNLATGDVEFTVLTPPKGSLTGDATICQGDSALLNIILAGGTSYDVTLSNGTILNGLTKDTTIFVEPTLTTAYQITNLVVQGNACPEQIGTGVTVMVNNVTVTGTVSDYNGFGVSCPESEDGSIDLTAQGGSTPYTAIWEPGQSGLNLDNLPAGTYTVTVSDQIGCTAEAEYILSAPLGFEFTPAAESPRCYGDRNGSITIPSVTGGAGPFAVTVNGLTFTVDTFPLVIPSLAAGNYEVVVSDLNGCMNVDTVEVIPVSELLIDLGADTTIRLGDSLALEAISNSSILEQITWSPLLYLNSVDSIYAVSKPFESIRYKVTAVDTLGCRSEDDILITVTRDIRVYIPNIFDPSSSSGNDFLTVYAGPEVTRIRSMRVYDRWGEMLFQNENFEPGLPNLGWDGRQRGKLVSPGVYVYVIDVEFVDGTTQIFSGDVTVLR